MKKTILLLFLLYYYIPVSADTNLFKVSRETVEQKLRPYMRYLPDHSGELTLQAVRSSEDWKPLPRSNLGYLPYPVWTRVTLRSQDSDAHRFILYNPRPGTNRIDVYLLHGDNLIETHELGLFRPFANHTLRHRFTALPVEIPLDRPLTVIARIESVGQVEVGWMLKSINTFSTWSIRENLLRGFIGGAILVAILYSLSLWFSLRQPVQLSYALYGTLMLALIFCFQGIYRIIHFGIPQEVFFYSIWPLLSLMNAAMIATTIFFFDTRAQMPRMHRWLQALTALMGLYLIAFIFAVQSPVLFRYSPVMHLSYLAVYLSLFITALIGLRKNPPGAWYFLTGHGSLCATLLLSNVSSVSDLLPFELMTNVIPLGILIDIGFLGMAISKRIGRIRHELEVQRQSTMIDSRFTAVGKTIGMITHQWRTPLARQGAILTEMEMLMAQEEKAPAMQRIEQILIPRMLENLTLMSDTVSDFRTYFSAGNQLKRYKPAAVIEQTLSLFTWQQPSQAVRMDYRPPTETFYLDGYPSILAQVLMIMVENALTIFDERRITTPQLVISLERKDETVSIIIEDNGGGISIQPIEHIFSGFVSGKRQESSGMGLYIANMLVKERLHGEIKAENTKTGACFTISLPLRTATAQNGLTGASS